MVEYKLVGAVKNDGLGDRMKNYEACSEYRLPSQTPIILRVDGKAFHTLTRKLKLERPVDDYFHHVMTAVAIKLCQSIENSRFAYTQSDEISILVYPKTVIAQPWFKNRIQKMTSVAAGIASSYITWLLADRLKEHCLDTESDNLTVYPCFDARIFAVPVHDVGNYFWWRQKDAIRNSAFAYGQAAFGAKKLNRLSSRKVVQKLLDEKQLDWHAEPTWKKWGSGILHTEKTTVFEETRVIRHEWAVTELPKLLDDRSIFGNGMLDVPAVPVAED